MDHKFLDYYNKELTFMREMAQEFAEKHPKIAGRLGMHGIEVADPYVERLIESFCFYLPERRLSWMLSFLNLLSVFWTCLSQLQFANPSMGVIQLKPNLKEGI